MTQKKLAAHAPTPDDECEPQPATAHEVACFRDRVGLWDTIETMRAEIDSARADRVEAMELVDGLGVELSALRARLDHMIVAALGPKVTPTGPDQARRWWESLRIDIRDAAGEMASITERRLEALVAYEVGEITRCELRRRAKALRTEQDALNAATPDTAA